MRTSSFLCFCIGLLLAMQTGPLSAALGQGPSKLATIAPSASTPSAKMLATTKSSSDLYTVHDTVMETGTAIREFANPDGQVFAITWQGPVLPDLSVLLGDYFQTFKTQAVITRQKGRLGSPVSINHGGLVINSMGRMRNFYGHAYAPALVPSNVNIKDVLP